MKESLSVEEFKLKVDKIVYMRDIGLLTEEELEMLKKKLLKDVHK